MKNVVFFLLFFLSSISVYSQFTPKIYSGIHAMYDRAFENNAYGAFEVGAELFEFKFLAPEIGVKYYSGSPNESEILNFDQNPPAGIAKFDSRFKSFVFSVGPKMRFGNEEAALVIIPEFNIGNIRTYKRYFVPRDNFYELTEEVEKTQAIKFWNFSAGIEENFFELDKVTFGVLLTYSTINTERPLKTCHWPALPEIIALVEKMVSDSSFEHISTSSNKPFFFGFSENVLVDFML